MHMICRVDEVLRTKEADDEAIHLFVLKACHDSPVTGHPGYKKTIELLRRSY